MAKRKSRKAAWAEGGSVDAQMEAMMAEGKDPVSGNDVPTGAMPNEVRDDVDAKLSEGEYVVPADVVRYFGVNFFEGLRDKAKQGWAEMESKGRVGGEPVGMEMGGDDLPFDLSELNIVDDGMDEQPEMSGGGFVKGYADGGIVVPDLPTDLLNIATAGGGSTGEEYKTFKNEAGMTLVIRFVDGKPMGYVPPGYEEQGTTASDVSEAVAEKVTKPEPEGGPDNQAQPEAVDYGSMTESELADAMSQNAIAGKVAIGLTAVNPALGLAAKAAVAHQKSQISKAQEALGVVAPEEDQSVLGKIAEDVTGFLSGIFGAKDETPAAPKGRPTNLGQTTNKGADNQGAQQSTNNNNAPSVDTSTAAQEASDLGFGDVQGGEFGGMGPDNSNAGVAEGSDSAGPTGNGSDAANGGLDGLGYI